VINQSHPKVLVLCTTSTGLDAVYEIYQRGFKLSAIIGVDPKKGNGQLISGYTDIAEFGRKISTPVYYVKSYSLKLESDKNLFENLEFDLVWVAGWQRLVPDWLITMSVLGVLGVHGSPDGIHGGRGRSPQNWALLLGCKQFDLALFKIQAGIDDGPIVSQRTFEYGENDDIRISYYRASLAVAEMMADVLEDSSILEKTVDQPSDAFYYPQRLPEDGYIDWANSGENIVRTCRALTKPYPGAKTISGGVEITIWECLFFDHLIQGLVGQISTCFYSGEFLVNCKNGRILVREWLAEEKNWNPIEGNMFSIKPFKEQIKNIIKRHEERFPDLPISSRILQIPEDF